MTGVVDWLGNTTIFAYDNDSNLVTQTNPNGVVTTDTFDNADRQSGATTVSGSTTLLHLAYTRDSLGNVTAENSTTYGYDGAQHLTSSSSGPSPLAYDQANQRTSAGPTTYVYDAAGEVSTGSVSSKVTNYAYDPEGERASITPPTGQASTYTWNQADDLNGFSHGSTTATYSYNGDGLRMSKTVGTAKYAYVWDVAEGTPLLIVDTLTDYVTGPGGLPLEQVTGSSVTYYTHDQLGSTRLLTNASGASVGTYTYTPYGTVTSHTGAVSTNLQFAGQFTDNETGLQYLQARYYDPATAQFVSVDPAVSWTMEAYAYANQNPLDGSDPSGMWCFPPWSSSCDVPIADAFVSSGFGQFLNGWANGVTFGGASALESTTTKGQENLAADVCSSWYGWGNVAGVVTDFALSGGAGAADSTADVAANPLADTSYSTKVLDQMAQDSNHGFPAQIDQFATNADTFSLPGNSGNWFTHVVVPGAKNGVDGAYHWIIGPDGIINHRMFEEP